MSVPAWCMDQRCVRNDPNPCLGSDDADIARASQLQHAVEDMDRHVHFGHPTAWCMDRLVGAGRLVGIGKVPVSNPGQRGARIRGVYATTPIPVWGQTM